MRRRHYLVTRLLGGDCQDGVSQIWRPKVRYCLVVGTRLAEVKLDPLSGVINGVCELEV